jgi:hypothetical protein
MKITISLLVLNLIFVCQGFGETKQDCIQECQRRNREKIDVINKLFNSSGDLAHFHNVQWQKEALDAAKNDFDNCRSTCQ